MKLPFFARSASLAAALAATFTLLSVAAPAHADGGIGSGISRRRAPHPVAIAATDNAAARPAPAHHRLAVAGVGGLIAPLGLFGVEVQYDPQPWLGLSAGVGAGFGGPQVGFMPRLTTPTHDLRAYIGAGISGGSPNNFLCFSNCATDGVEVHGNLETGIELQSDSPVFLRLFVGMSKTLNDTADGGPSRVDTMPYCGLALGLAR